MEKFFLNSNLNFPWQDGINFFSPPSSSPKSPWAGDFLGEGRGSLCKQGIKPWRRKISLERFGESYLNRFFFLSACWAVFAPWQCPQSLQAALTWEGKDRIHLVIQESKELNYVRLKKAPPKKALEAFQKLFYCSLKPVSGKGDVGDIKSHSSYTKIRSPNTEEVSFPGCFPFPLFFPFPDFLSSFFPPCASSLQMWKYKKKFPLKLSTISGSLRLWPCAELALQSQIRFLNSFSINHLRF